MCRVVSWLNQVPEIAIEVFEDGYCSVGFFAWWACEVNSVSGHGMVVAFEIVGEEEEEYAAAGLVADAGYLGFCGCLC